MGKFDQFSAQNRMYIMTLWQAPMYARTNEDAATGKGCESELYVGVLIAK